MNRTLFSLVGGNELVLSLARGAVRRGADGIPTAFRLLAAGPMSLTIDGKTIEGDILPEQITAIAKYAQLKGEAIPIDCEHLLRVLADLKGVEEADLVKADPLLAERGAAGFVSLREEAGELWAHVEKWSARARELLSAASDRMYGYMSPVIRGLKNGPLRITSIALTNNPALNNQELLAAAGEAQTRLVTATARTGTRQNENGGTRMKETLKRLGELLGLDVAALSAEGADLTPLLAKAAEAVETARASVTGFFQQVGKALSLAENATLDSAAGTILGLAEKAKCDAAALTDLQGRVQDLEGKEKVRRIDGLLAEGKLTEAMKPWAERQDVAALNDWAKTAPVIVQPRRLIDPATLPENQDTVAMNDALVRVAARCGVSLEDIEKRTGKKG